MIFNFRNSPLLVQIWGWRSDNLISGIQFIDGTKVGKCGEYNKQIGTKDIPLLQSERIVGVKAKLTDSSPQLRDLVFVIATLE